VLQLHGVSKSFGQTQALAATDLEIPGGSTSVLIGPSGCGKSTLLRSILLLVRPDSGRIVFEDEEVTDDNVIEVRRKTGYVIQEGGLFPHLTARRNATLMAEQLGWKDDRIDKRVKELAELTHLPEDSLDRYPVQLSGGQRQRVSLMRALFLDPDMLLLDEPLGALDPVIRSGLQEEMREIFRTLGKTVLMVTHDLGEAGFFADDIVLLRDGGLVQRGSIKDLMHNPANDFVSEFIRAQRSPLDLSEGESS